MNCVHCQGRKASCPRRLCRSCYDRPDVREQHKKLWRTHKKFMSGVGLAATDDEPEPTDAMPGSEDKVRELVRRAGEGKRLWSKEDAEVSD